MNQNELDICEPLQTVPNWHKRHQRKETRQILIIINEVLLLRIMITSLYSFAILFVFVMWYLLYISSMGSIPTDLIIFSFSVFLFAGEKVGWSISVNDDVIIRIGRVGAKNHKVKRAVRNVLQNLKTKQNRMLSSL